MFTSGEVASDDRLLVVSSNPEVLLYDALANSATVVQADEGMGTLRQARLIATWPSFISEKRAKATQRLAVVTVGGGHGCVQTG